MRNVEEEQKTFVETVQDEAKAAPWYMGSTIIHMILLLLLMLVPTVKERETRKKVIIKTMIEEPEDIKEEDKPEPEKTNEEVIKEITKTTDNPVQTDVVSEVDIKTEVDVNTEISVDDPVELPSEETDDNLESLEDDAAPSLMGLKGQFSSKNGLSSGFRGDIGKVGNGIKNIVGSNSGGSRGLCLIWLLDQSGSMKDDQEQVAKQAQDIQNLLTDGGAKDMLSGVITFGKHWQLTQPLTKNSNKIKDSILNVEVDTTGVENTNQAIIYACEEVMSKMKNWTKVIVLLSDESSSDQKKQYNETSELKLKGLSKKASLIDLAAASLVKSKTRLFVIGKESPFQENTVREPFVDSSGKRWILPVNRGPETVEVEVPIANSFRLDHRYRGVGDYVKSGFGVYDLSYLAKVSRGAYFILDSTEESKVRMSASERARNPFKLCWKVMDQYKPLIVARSDYMKALFKTEQGKRLWQLNEFFSKEGKNIRRFDRSAARTNEFTMRRNQMRRRASLLEKLIKKIRSSVATDEEVRDMDQKRQVANLDIYYCVLLADQIITTSMLDAFEKYNGPLDSCPVGWRDGLSLRVKSGDNLSDEDRKIFDSRMLKLTQACNTVILRHRNTPYAIAARQLQAGPRKWGRPYELVYSKSKIVPRVHKPHVPQPKPPVM
jgi:uncharacterized protein YegL